MEVIEVDQGKKLQRVAARNELNFYIEGYSVYYTHGEENPRRATDEEMALWERLCPKDLDFPATWEEIDKAFYYSEGPFTINAADFAVLRQHGLGRFEPNVDRDSLRWGYIGCFDTTKQVYLSRAIPVGFFYEGPHQPELHPDPRKLQDLRKLGQLPLKISEEVSSLVWLYTFPFGVRR